MKKMITALFIAFLTIRCWAPGGIYQASIIAEEPIYIFNLKDPVARTFAYYESRFKIHAVNKVSGARGIFQFMPVMIREVNEICKLTDNPKRYTWNDAFNPQKSIEMWYIVQNYHNPEYDVAKACKIWFGSGVQYDGKTWKQYYADIKTLLKL